VRKLGMKKYTYFISIISCVVLAYTLVSMKKYFLAIIAGALFVYYLWKIINEYKNKPQSNIESSVRTNDRASKEKALSELKELLRVYTRNMRIFRNATVTGYLLSAVIMFLNMQLAIACGILLIPVAYKFYKNYQAVRLIETGISNK
jgi:hypothetical protein